MKVSVAMCTFNGAHYLPQQLESIARQTRRPDEIVICDDGSSDRTLEILEKFRAVYPHTVRIVRNAERLGPAKNFEQAIALTSGEAVALADQDDVWYPEKIERLTAVLEKDPGIGLVFSNARCIDGEGKPFPFDLWEAVGINGSIKQLIAADRLFEVILKRGLIVGCCLMFRGGLKSLALPVEAELGHDWWITTVAAFFSHIVYVDAYLMDYRVHGQNSSNTVIVGWPLGTQLKLSLHLSPEGRFRHMAAVLNGLLRLQRMAEVSGLSEDRLDFLRNMTGFIEDRMAIWSGEETAVGKARRVIRNAVRGRYGRYARWASLLRDLVGVLAAQ